MFRMVSDFLLAKVAKFDIIISEVKQGGESNVQIIGKIDTDTCERKISFTNPNQTTIIKIG